MLAIMPVFTQQFLDDGKNLFIYVKWPIAVSLFYPDLKDLPDKIFLHVCSDLCLKGKS